MNETVNEPVSRPKLVIFPGGQARQYRVQYQASASLGWQKFAIYPRRTEAEACVDRLQQGGYEARLIDFRYFPVAG